ncbi:MAG: TolC family protein [Elusimicrobiota bacterium]|nr:TolC family protein [Elusimicrobiota bacterium]
MKKSFLFLFIAALVPGRGPSAAQEPPPALTLPATLSEVRTANPSLAAARRQLDLLEAEVIINSAYPNPSIEIDKAASSGSDGYEIKAVQPVPLTRRAGTAGAATRASYEAAQKELQALETVILSAARKTWYALRIAKERRSFEETNLRFSMDILNKIEMRLQTGEAGNADLARAKVETSRSGLHLHEAETTLRAAAGELNTLMGRRPDAPAAVSENGGFSLAPVAPALEPLEKYTELALARRSEPRALALNARAADLGVALEKSKRLPVPELGLIRGSGGGTGYTRLFLGLELPLWYSNKGEIKRALAHKASLDYEAQRLELEIRREVYSAWLELGLAQKRLAASRETVALLNDLRRTASQDYLSGKIDLAAFYETNRVFLEENVSYLDALNGYYEKTAQLEAAANSGEEK